MTRFLFAGIFLVERAYGYEGESTYARCHPRERTPGPVWQEWLEGLHMRHESDGTRVLIGQIQDQPALSGLLLTLTQLSISLLSLQSSEPMRRPYPEWHQPAHQKRRDEGSLMIVLDQRS